MQWFDVDKDGLAKLLERKGKVWAIHELIQNAWDTKASRLNVSFERLSGSSYVEVIVQDNDPHGFLKLEHAFTLFAESDKKGDPSKRGRFNLGEKLVLALCREAVIQSTTGTVTFGAAGRRRSSQKTLGGSIFRGQMRITKEELEEIKVALNSLIVPEWPETIIDGVQLAPHHMVDQVDCNLPTEISDAEGYLRRTRRQTKIQVYEVESRAQRYEKAHLYEMGIPIVELPGDKWHVNICQKVPLNIDRDNVTPAYLREVRVAVLNLMADALTTEDAKESWVRDAAGDEMASAEAIETVMHLRFGEKRVIADPSDPEGTKLAMSQGYTVIGGGSLSAGEWENVRRTGAALPAGQVTPSPKPYGDSGDFEKLVPEEKWSADVRRFVGDAKALGKFLINADVTIRVVNEPHVYWTANYGGSGQVGRMAINLGKLREQWFRKSNEEDQLSLLLHEFGHHFASDHLSSEYHRALCTLGAKLASKLAGRLSGAFPERTSLNLFDSVHETTALRAG